MSHAGPATGIIVDHVLYVEGVETSTWRDAKPTGEWEDRYHGDRGTILQRISGDTRPA